MDPIERLSELAVRRKLPLHVDSCFGGFMLPWLEKQGYPIPVFDFRLPGVTSMSADIHKYGFGAKVWCQHFNIYLVKVYVSLPLTVGVFLLNN